MIFDTTGSKTDTALDQTIAENLIKNQDVEVIWPNIGIGSLSVYTAAALNNAYAIGVDINQDALEPGSILTSGLHNTTYMVVEMVTKWQQNELNGLNEYYWGLSTGVVGITDMATIAQYADNKENFDRVMGIINEYKQKIESGEFVVFNYFVEGNTLYSEWAEQHPGVNYSEWVNAGRP